MAATRPGLKFNEPKLPSTIRWRYHPSVANRTAWLARNCLLPAPDQLMIDLL
jgi:hypothetical protein